MKDLSRKVLNLFIVLALLLVLVPQQHSTATPMRSEDRPEEVKDPETYFTEMVAGPEKEALGETQMARSRVLTVAGWHFKAYWTECLDKFQNYPVGRIGPKATLTEECMITAPLILPNGTKITHVDVNYFDESDEDLKLIIHRFKYDGSDTTGDPIVTVYSLGDYGFGDNFEPVGHTLEAFSSYNIIVNFPEGAGRNLQFSSVNIRYEEPGIFGNGFPVIMQKP